MGILVKDIEIMFQILLKCPSSYSKFESDFFTTIFNFNMLNLASSVKNLTTFNTAENDFYQSLTKIILSLILDNPVILSDLIF